MQSLVYTFAIDSESLRSNCIPLGPGFRRRFGENSLCGANSQSLGQPCPAFSAQIHPAEHPGSHYSAIRRIASGGWTFFAASRYSCTVTGSWSSWISAVDASSALLSTPARWMDPAFAACSVKELPAPRCCRPHSAQITTPCSNSIAGRRISACLVFPKSSRCRRADVTPTHRAIGTIRRELLDQIPFWHPLDLEQKLADLRDFYNDARTHIECRALRPHSKQAPSERRLPA